MHVIFEVSRPIQWRPGLYKSRLTKRVWWLYFAISFHPMREDELFTLISEGKTVWGPEAA